MNKDKHLVIEPDDRFEITEKGKEYLRKVRKRKPSVKRKSLRND